MAVKPGFRREPDGAAGAGPDISLNIFILTDYPNVETNMFVSTAALLDISPRTADRDLAYARAWLGKEILRLRA